MRKLTFLLACFFIASIGWLSAQSKTISGKVVSSEDGQPVIGATVKVKGSTTGTITDTNGVFKITVGLGKTLVVSYVGMKNSEVIAADGILIKLVSDSKLIDEVVVTALGISREKKSLGYAVQEVSGDEVNQVKGDNFINSISGKVSGIQIKNNTNFGGSTNVIIRGSSSLTGNNQALFVVDGVPVDNSNSNNSGQTTGRSGYDYGNGASDINPNDIESISVLKGAAATALYGSRASHGVILITTKKGKAGKKSIASVRVSSNLTVNTVDKSTLPTYQKEYGAGYSMSGYSSSADGSSYPALEHYADVNGDGVIDYTTPYYEDASRGQKFDPSIKVYQWDAFDPESPNYMKATPWVAGANDATTFFETGFSNTNSVEVAGGTEVTDYRFSFTNFHQKGVMPNSHMDKYNVLFNGSHLIAKNLKLTSSANYINTSTLGRPSTGYSDNIMSSFRQWFEVNADMSMLKYMYNTTGRNVTWNRTAWDDGTPAYWDNPYWVRYKNYETDGKSRLVGYAQLDWDIIKGLKATTRYSIDTYSQLQEERKAVGSVAGELGVNRPDVTSGYSRYTRLFTETNFDAMLNYHTAITEKVDFTGLIGANIRRTRSQSVFESTNNGLAVAGVYALSNSVDAMLPPEETSTVVGVNGLYASASLGFVNTYFLDATIRRDQSSTLPSANNAYFYPSVTGSYVFSNQLKDLEWLSLGKIRLNYAEVGSSAPALSVKDTYSANAPFSGTSLVTVPNTKQNENLKPERQRALEGGLELNFLKNRVGVDFAYYKNNTVDQLMPVSVSYATGYSSKWVNAGEIENKGLEIALSGTPIKTKDFSWDVKINYARNRNKVVSLYTDESGNEVTNLVLGSLQGGVSINATVGQPYGTIKGSDFVYVNGQKTINASNGRYYKTSTSDQVIGNVNPDWTGSIRNSFRYKNITCSFLIDASIGGDIFSLDMWYGTGTGLYKETAGLNDLGNPKRNAIVWADASDHSKGYASTSGGVIEDGVIVQSDGTTVKNYVRRNQQNYAAIGWYADPNKRFVYDASYVKLRELTVSYSFPKRIISKLSMTDASLSVVGSNLWILFKNLPYADPEASQSSGNIQGWQSGVMPSTRNIGVTLNLQF